MFGFNETQIMSRQHLKNSGGTNKIYYNVLNMLARILKWIVFRLDYLASPTQLQHDKKIGFWFSVVIVVQTH